MDYQFGPIEEPRSSLGGMLFRATIGIALFAAGLRLGYCTDPDWDDDGVPNAVELACHLDPHNKDTDGDGIADGRDRYPCDRNQVNPSADTSHIVLTKKNGERFWIHPTDIVLIDILTIDGKETYELNFWDAQGPEAENIRESLTEVENRLWSIGYPHFLRVHRKYLPNMLHAVCLNKDTLYLNVDENITCFVSRGHLKEVKARVDWPCR